MITNARHFLNICLSASLFAASNAHSQDSDADENYLADFGDSSANWSDFRDETPLIDVFVQPVGGPYSTTWGISLEIVEGSRRIIYVETNERLQWTGTLLFDCETGLAGRTVAITQASRVGYPTVYDPTLTLSDAEVEQWRQSDLINDVVSDERSELVSFLPPFEVYVISRFEACRRSQ